MKNLIFYLLICGGCFIEVFAQPNNKVINKILIDSLPYQSLWIKLSEKGALKESSSKFLTLSYSFLRDWSNTLKTGDKITLTVATPEASKFLIQLSDLQKKSQSINRSAVYGNIFSPIYSFSSFSNSIRAPQLSATKYVEYDPSDPWVPFKPFVYTDTLKDTTLPNVKVFKLAFKRPSKENEIIVRHLAASKVEYKKHWDPLNNPTFQEISQNFRSLKGTIDSLLVLDSARYLPNQQPFNIEVMKNLVRLIPYQKNIDTIFDEVMNENRDWIKRWLWYTGGEVKLNPFPYFNTALLLKRAYAQKRVVEDRAALLKSSVASGAFSNFSINEQNLTRLSAALVAINEQITLLKSDSAQSTEWLSKVKQKSKVLYEGEWPISTPDKINWLVHYTYDAQKKKLTAQTKSEHLPSFTSLQDQRAILIHNVPAGAEITAKTTEKVIQLKSSTDSSLSVFSANFGESLKGIDNVNKILASLGPLLGTALKVASAGTGFGARSSSEVKLQTLNNRNRISSWDSLLNDVQKSLDFFKIIPDGSNLFDNELNRIKNQVIPNSATPLEISNFAVLFKAQDLINSYPRLISDYRNTKLKHDWLSEQTVPLLEIKNYEDDTTPAYRTIVLYPEDSLTLKKTKEVNCDLFLDKTQLAKTKYQKHELIRWWPAMGGVWVHGNRGYNVYDAAKGTLVQEPVSRFEAIVGVKLYPFKTNIAYKNSDAQLTRLGKHYNRKRGNSILNRGFFFGGLGVTKNIFKNYCLGVGVDIIPGISMQTGFNFISQKSYEFDKGVIKNESEYLKRYPYFGISVDPGIITKIIGAFR